MSNLDVLLITPPSRLEVYQDLSNDFAAIEPPVWSSLIANYLLKNNYTAKILDAEADHLTHKETAEEIKKEDPKLAVFIVYGQQPSASTQCMPAARKTSKILNEITNNTINTIVIGTHPSALPRRTLEEEPYKYVCQGEGPLTIKFLLDYINGTIKDINKVPGLWFIENGRVSSNKPAPIIENLDQDLDGQSWDLLDMSKYKAHNWHTFHDLDSRNKYASLQTSLGCPFKCSFCCINAPFQTNKIRFWTPKHIINQIDILVKKYGIFNIKLPDEMFVLNPKQVSGICDEILKKDYSDKLNFWAYARVDTLNNNDMLKKMRKTGFNWLAIGIESSSEHVRDGVAKGRFNNFNIKEIVKKVRDLGFYVGANYIFGLPDDDFDSMKKTLELSLDINSEWANYYSAMAYPGSQLYNFAKEKKWRLPDDEGGPGWIGYSQHAFDSLPLRTDKIKASDVLDFRDQAFNEYFKSSDYLKLIENTFGKKTVSHINEMTTYKIPRKHHKEEVDY